MLKTIPLILLGVLLNACAQLALKLGMTHLGVVDFSAKRLVGLAASILLNWWVIAGLACYVVSVGLWMVVLSRVEVSFAYPFLSIGYVVTALVAYFYFGENVSVMRMFGIGLICVGVAVIARS
jgi:multidrug transporter EmrE-like cation transporter